MTDTDQAMAPRVMKVVMRTAPDPLGAQERHLTEAAGHQGGREAVRNSSQGSHCSFTRASPFIQRTVMPGMLGTELVIPVLPHRNPQYG